MIPKIKTFAGVALALFLCLLTAPAFALASLGLDPAVPPVDDIAVYGGLLLAVLEVVLRLKPTNKDYSLVTKLIQVLNLLVPNRAKTPAGNGLFSLSVFKRRK